MPDKVTVRESNGYLVKAAVGRNVSAKGYVSVKDHCDVSNPDRSFHVYAIGHNLQYVPLSRLRSHFGEDLASRISGSFFIMKGKGEKPSVSSIEKVIDMVLRKVSRLEEGKK